MPEANQIVISHQVELGPELSNEVMDAARRQGEDPDTFHLKIQELRDMIYGELSRGFFFSRIYIESSKKIQ